MTVITLGHCLCKRCSLEAPHSLRLCLRGEGGGKAFMRRLWLWSRDTWRHSTWPCLRGSSDRLSVSVQMDCELRDRLEILSEEPLTARGPGLAVGCNGHPVLPVASEFLSGRQTVNPIPPPVMVWKTAVWYPRGRDLIWTS